VVSTAQRQTQVVGSDGTHYYTYSFSYPPGYTDIIPAQGDWLDLLSLNNSNYASCFYIALNNGSPFPASYLPVRSPFYMIHVYNGCSATVSGTFIIGRELFQPAKINVALPAVMNVNVQSPLDSNGNLKVGIYSPLDSLGYVRTDITVKNGSEPYWSTALLTNQTITSNGSTSIINVPDYLHFLVLIYVTAVSGTSPSLNVYLNVVDEQNNNQAVPVASVTNITSTGTYYISATNLPAGNINVSWTVGGTSPSFTVTITLHMKW
jgi:hypothetical protein